MQLTAKNGLFIIKKAEPGYLIREIKSEIKSVYLALCASLHISSKQARMVFHTPRFNNQACLHMTKEKGNQHQELVP
jgi:hypothetical protein